MASGPLWEAQEAEFYITDAAFTVSTTVPMYDTLQAATDEINFTGRCRDIRISGGVQDVAAVNTLGINQLIHEQRPPIVEAVFTIIYQEGMTAKYVGGAATTLTSTVITAASGFDQYNYGEKSTSAARRSSHGVFLVLDNGDTDASADRQLVVCALNEAYCTSREMSLNSEGYVEERLTFKCLAQNYREEDNFSGTYE